MRSRVSVHLSNHFCSSGPQMERLFFMKKLTKSHQNTPRLQFNGNCYKVTEPYKGVGIHN